MGVLQLFIAFSFTPYLKLIFIVYAQAHVQ